MPDILIPQKGTDLEKWAVIACDQYTSEPEYWKKAEEKAGDAPSALNLQPWEFIVFDTQSGCYRSGKRFDHERNY